MCKGLIIRCKMGRKIAKPIASVIDLIVSAIASTHLRARALRAYLLKLIRMAGKKAIFLVR